MWPYSGEYQNKHVMVQDGKEFERVGEEWVRVELRDPKQRSEEEKKIVQQVGSSRYCSPRHQTLFEPSLLELNGTL